MPKIQRLLLRCAAALCLASATLLAQQRFTSTTSLLTLDVSVLDRDGNPVTDLAPSDFVVTLNKEARLVQTMVFLATNTKTTAESVRAAAAGSAPVPSSSATASDPSREPDPKLLVIMIDDNSIYPTDSKGLFVAAERFIDTIPARDWVGLASTSGRMTVNPSLDRAPLMKNLKRAFGWMNDPRRDTKPFVGLMEALEADASGGYLLDVIAKYCGVPTGPSKNLALLLAENQCAHEVDLKVRNNATFARIATRNQLDTYAAVINAMASATGVKQLVILTGGTALRPVDSLDFVPVAKAAIAAGVQITMLMEEPGDEVAPPGFVQDQRQMLQQAETLAEMSGGQFFRVVGQADRFYQRVLKSSSAIYRIGVDLPKSVPSDGNYKVEVTVKRPGVKVLSSRYAAPPVPKVMLTPEQQMQHAITTGEPLYALPVQMAADIAPARANSPIAIQVSIDVPGEMPGPISGILGVLSPDRVLKTSRHDLIRSGDGKTYILDLLVPANVGTYELRFAAADASGAVGAVTRTIIVKAGL